LVQFEGYEADDIAASVVQLYRTKAVPELNAREIYLHTVDTDWLQLTGEGVLWVNTGPWAPRLRDHVAALAYIEKKSLKRTHKKLGGIKHPHDIVKVKVIEGDKSDNLVAGYVDPRMIDLLNPPAEFNLLTQADKIKEIIQKFPQGDNRNLEHYSKSINFLLQMGLPFPCSTSQEAKI
jgi:5'-3' exonuclease